MVIRCPHCGRELAKPLKDGLSSCIKCNAIIESSIKNRLLSGAWDLLRSNNQCFEQFKFECKLPHPEAYFVYHYLEEKCYSLDEFRKVVKTISGDKLPCLSNSSA